MAFPYFNRIYSHPRSLIGVTAFAFLIATATPLAQIAAPVDSPTVQRQPANVGDAKTAALAYHDSGAYDRDLATVASEASRWLEQRGRSAIRPALVLDIDETALSNWEVIKLDDFARPIPTLQVFELARTLNFTVFFITGRPESQREATERNLAEAGYKAYQRLYMTPDGAHFPSAADFKAPIREEIEKAGYIIVANVGDQPSDLRGGHAEKVFLLPNPFYRVP
jgi:predicted secreted acid phosphatase